MFNIDPYLYITIYYSIVATLCFIFSAKLLSTNDDSVLYAENNNYLVIIGMVLILAFWLGMRDVTSNAFCDTVLYAQMYSYMSNPDLNFNIEDSDFGWNLLMAIFTKYGFTVSVFFTAVALVYFSFNTIAIKRIFQSNIWGPFLIFLISFSTFAFCVNGIRNGLATSFAILGISYVITFRKPDIILGFCLMLLGCTIHKTVVLPTMCLLAVLFIRNFKVCLAIWFASIFLSLLFGNYFANIFASLGFDDRMAAYLNSGIEFAQKGYNVGFRADFLIFSCVPIVLGYYAIIKKGIQDDVYVTLLNTYVIANSFWILVIRAAFSNRFAYLSWFIYPVVLAYPLFKLELWEDQDRKVAMIIIGYVMITLLI